MFSRIRYPDGMRGKRGKGSTHSGEEVSVGLKVVRMVQKEGPPRRRGGHGTTEDGADAETKEMEGAGVLTWPPLLKR